MVSEGNDKVWVPIGDNKYVGIRRKNDQGVSYEPLDPAKKRKTESDPEPKAPPPPPPASAHLSTIMPQAMMNPMMNHMLPSMQQTPPMLPKPSTMSPYQFPMQNSMMHLPAYNQQAFYPHSTMPMYQQHVYNPTPNQPPTIMAPTAHPIHVTQQSPKAETPAPDKHEEMPQSNVSGSSMSIPAAPGVPQERK